MDKKTTFYIVVAILLLGGMLPSRLAPRQRRALQPYLIRGALFTAPALAVSIGLILVVRLKRRNARIRKQQLLDQAVAEGETWLLLRPKETRPVDVEKISLWKRLAYAQPTNEHFSFEAYGNSEHQGLAIHASQTKSRAILGEYFQEWSDMQRRPAGEADPALVPEGWHVYWVEVGPASAEKPITRSSRDPLLGVLSEIANVPAPTRTLMQVIARSDITMRRQLGQKSASMRSVEVKDAGARYQHTKEAKILEQRGSRVFLQTVIRVAAFSTSPLEAHRTAVALANTLCNQFGPDNPVIILARSNPKEPLTLAARSISAGALRSWADDEIAALAHLPGGDVLKFAPLLSTGSAKSLPAGPDLRIPKTARVAKCEVHPHS